MCHSDESVSKHCILRMRFAVLVQAPVQISHMQSCNETHLAAQLCQASLVAHSCLGGKHFAVGTSTWHEQRSVSEQHNN
jgi:hypothetical protein